MTDQTTQGVDEMPPPQRLAALGIQHVLVMYAGAVAVPFIISGALACRPSSARCSSTRTFRLRPWTLRAIARLPGVGIRLPVMMGVTFASGGVMMAMIGAGQGRDATGCDPAQYLWRCHRSWNWRCSCRR